MEERLLTLLDSQYLIEFKIHFIVHTLREHAVYEHTDFTDCVHYNHIKRALCNTLKITSVYYHLFEDAPIQFKQRKLH